MQICDVFSQYVLVLSHCNCYIPVCVIVLCEACREGHDSVSWSSQLTEFLPVKVVLYLLTFLLLLPIELTLLLTKR